MLPGDARVTIDVPRPHDERAATMTITKLGEDCKATKERTYLLTGGQERMLDHVIAEILREHRSA